MRLARPLTSTQLLLALALAGVSPYAFASQATGNDCNCTVPATDANDTENRTPTKPAAPTRKNPNTPASRTNAAETATTPRSTRWQSFVPGMFR